MPWENYVAKQQRIGERLSRAMAKARMDCRKLAALTSYSEAQIVSWERGRAPLYPTELIRLCHALDVKPEWLPCWEGRVYRSFLCSELAEHLFRSIWHQMTEENMHTFKVAFVCAFAGAAMACNVASLDAAPLPTNAAAMKSIVVDTSIQVRWGGWRGGGWGHGGFGGWGAGALAGAIIGGAIASSAYGYYGGPYYGAYYPGYSYYPAYVGYGPYYDYGPWQAIQEPGAARFYRPYGYGWRPWGY
jgi:transcriptional regulator with XRE-family HTH domain